MQRYIYGISKRPAREDIKQNELFWSLVKSHEQNIASRFRQGIDSIEPLERYAYDLLIFLDDVNQLYFYDPIDMYKCRGQLLEVVEHPKIFQPKELNKKEFFNLFIRYAKIKIEKDFNFKLKYRSMYNGKKDRKSFHIRKQRASPLAKKR